MKARTAVALLVVSMACGGSPPSPEPAPVQPSAPTAATSANDTFTELADRLYWAHFEFRPHAAIQLGHHRYDGRVPDRSATAITAEIERLRAAEAALIATDAGALSPANQLDREVLLAEVRKELFVLAERRRPQREPIYYLLFDFSLSPYVDRDYAPLAQRAAGLLTACRAAPTYYRQMLANLEPALARPALQIGLFMTDGTSKLVDTAIRAAMAEVADDQLRGDISRCLDDLVATLGEVRADLGARMPKATDDFALGEEQFLRMLSVTQGIDTDLAALERIGTADLERNLAAIAAAARQIDPDAEPRAVIAAAAADKPADVLAEASRQVAAMRSFVIENQIASIPGTDVAEVRPSPPHKRGNMASLSSAGPFEERALPSFYYISPPDPSWPADKQRAYLPSIADLLFLSIHEVWPGHFLQGRHIAAHGSRILQSFETYSTSEGWAHYAEEMMWDAGVGDGDPRVHIGQLKNALLRNVRFLVAIGMHCRGMTVDQAAAMFRDKAFADEGTARQQALRGTADPMYLSYTLGKLAIGKLHRDWRAQQGATYSLRAFHDTFLGHGEAPLGVIRRMMLGANAGPVL